eukprot:scaffold11237_cov139-Isochrysis_galbana.AAC.1
MTSWCVDGDGGDLFRVLARPVHRIVVVLALRVVKSSMRVRFFGELGAFDLGLCVRAAFEVALRDGDAATFIADIVPRRRFLNDLAMLLPHLVQQAFRPNDRHATAVHVTHIAPPQLLGGGFVRVPLPPIGLVPLHCVALLSHPSVQLPSILADAAILPRRTAHLQLPLFPRVGPSTCEGGL